MLDELQTRIADKNVLLLGVGNRQREDDGVGSYLVRRLQRKIRIPSLDAGDVPENYIKQIENSGADFLLIVDAADFGANPGEIALLDLGDLKNFVPCLKVYKKAFLCKYRYKIVQVPF